MLENIKGQKNLALKLVNDVINNGRTLNEVLKELTSKFKKNDNLNGLEVFSNVLELLREVGVSTDVEPMIKKGRYKQHKLETIDLLNVIISGDNYIKDFQRLTRRGHRFLSDEDVSDLFMIAIDNDEIELIKIFIKNKLNKDILIGKNESTPVMYAMKNRNFEIAKFLIENGADLSVVNKEKGNLLHHTTMLKDGVTLVENLLNNKIDINSMDAVGNNTLSFAIRMRNYKVASLLLEKGIDLKPAIKSKNHNGIEALGENISVSETNEERDFWIKLLNILQNKIKSNSESKDVIAPEKKTDPKMK